jgi:putative ABC transport system permease protein
MSAGVLSQSLVVARLSLAGLRTRFWPALVIVSSVAGVVGVLLSMLALTAGLIQAFGATGDAGQALVLSSNDPVEYSCDIQRNTLGTILDAPGIARDVDGDAIADADTYVFLPPPPGMPGAGIPLRGVGTKGISLRPGFRVIEGRMFRSGRQEVVAGVGLQRAGLKVGDTVSQPDGEWPVVGVFSADGASIEQNLFADADTVLATYRRTCFSSVRVKLQDTTSFESLRRWLASNPRLAVTAERQTDYYARVASRESRQFTALAFLVGIVMAVGALFGTVKIMYAAVSARTREIATLRALGYEPFAVAFSFVAEALVLSLVGALIGAGIAWLLFDGEMTTYFGHESYALAVAPWQFAIGFEWAAIIAIIGSLPPAVRAARLTVIEGLRAG